MRTIFSPKLTRPLFDFKEKIRRLSLLCVCITVFSTSVNAQSTLTADDKAFTGPLQKVKVNVLANDAVSCSNYNLQILSSLDPVTQGVATVLPHGYIEFMPGANCRGATVDILYKITCGMTESTATLSVNVSMYNYPVNAIDENVNCYDIMPSNIPFGIKEKFKTENGSPTTGYCIDGMSSPLVGDLNGDGKPEIVIMGVSNRFSDGAKVNYRYICIYNGQNGSRMYRFDLGAEYNMGEPYHRAPSSLALADLDNDGIGEIVVATSDGTVRAYKPIFNNVNITGLNLMWTGNVGGTPVSYAAPLTASRSNFGYPHPYIADLNGDGIPEVIIYNKIFNGRTGALLMSWRNNAPGSAPKSSSILAGQNGLDQLSLANSNTPATSASAATIKNTAMTGRRIGSIGSSNDGFLAVPVIVDIDGDGQQEIIAGNRIHKFQFNSLTDHTKNTYYTIEGPASVTLPITTGGSTETFYLSDGFTRVADIDGDGNLDIIVAAFANNGSEKVNVLVYVWELQNPTTVKAANTFYSEGDYGSFSIPFIGDINGKYDGWDGTAYTRKIPEICILAGSIYINRTNSNNGRSGILFHPLSDEKLRQGTAGSSGTAAGWNNNETSNSNRRFNRSSSGEFAGHIIGLTYDAQATKVEEKLKLSWGMGHSDKSDNTGITLFDFDNNNTMDICYRDERSLRVISPAKGNNGAGSDFVPYDETEKTTGTSIMFKTEVFSGTGFEYPTIADVNMDGSADILVTQSAASHSVSAAAGYIKVFEYSGQKWAPCPPVWNQSMYDPTQIREDLKINAYPQPMLTPYVKNGKTIYPFNGSWIQQPIIKMNYDYVPIVRHPDAVLRNVVVKVQSTTVTEVTITLFNKGTSTISSSTPLSFYNGGTTGKDFANSSFITMQEVGTDIFPNETKILTFTISGDFNDCLIWTRVMANNTEFPASGYDDCNLTNNTMEGIDCPYLNVKTTVFPDNVICGANGVAKLSVTSISGGTFTYTQTPTFQWYKNDIAIPNGTDSILIVSEEGLYNCMVTDGLCRKKTQDEIITVDPNINIDQLVLNGVPESGYLCKPSEQVEITVGNLGSYTIPLINYMWYKDDVYQPTHTTETYIASLPGTYRLLLSSGSCMTTKTFVVTHTNYQIPDITPVSSLAAICPGNTLSLTTPTVTANGCEIKSQGWQISTVTGGSTFVPFDPSTRLTETDNGKNIRYYAANDCGTTYSNVSAITLMSVPTIETVSSPPGMCAGSNFSVAVPAVTDNGGSDPVTSSWQIETSVGSDNYTDISTSYVVQAIDNGKKIRYRATNSCGDGYSNVVEIIVNPLPVPVITGPSTAAKGQREVVYTTDTGKNDYIWTITGGTITSGGDNYDEAIVTWGNESSGTISLTYESNGCQAAVPTSKTVTLTSQSAPTINGATSVCPTTQYTYTTDAGKFDYQWTILGGSPVSTTIGSNTITVIWDGSDAPSVKVSYRHENNPGLPPVEITENNITKQQITNITVPPVGETICYNNSHTMSVAADCEGNPSYQWQKDGADVGTNSASYTATETGKYTVTVTGTCGTATSTPVIVTVKNQPVAALNGSMSVVITEEVIYVADPGANYNWDIGTATLVSGGTTADNTVTVKWATTGAKDIKVSYTVDGCPTTTDIINVTVSAQGTPVIDPPALTKEVCFQTTETYATQSGKFKYQWIVSGGQIQSGANDYEVTVLWGAAGKGTIAVAYSESATADPTSSIPEDITIYNKPTVGSINAPAGVCDNTMLYLNTPSVTSDLIVTQGWKLNNAPFTSGTTVSYAQNGQDLVYEVANSCGSASTNQVTITVYPTPTAGTFQDITSLCSGNSQSDIIPSTGSNISYYTWNGGTSVGMPSYSGTDKSYIPGFTSLSVGSVTSATIHVMPHYTNSGSTCNGTPTSFNITVNPLPVPTINGHTTVAKEQAGVVYTTETGKSNYVWEVTGGTFSTGGNTAGNTDNVTVNWGNTSSGTISVSYQLNGCSAITPTVQAVTLMDQSIPVISGTATVCPLTPYTYTTDKDKYNYQWTIEGGTAQSSSTDSNTVTVLWDGSATPKITVSYRHENNPNLPLVSASRNIVKQQVTDITTQPTGNTICYNDSHLMTVVANYEGTPSYHWKKDGVNVGTNSASYVATETGNYTVTVTGTCGTDTSTPATVTVKNQSAATLNGPEIIILNQEVSYTAGTGNNYTWNISGATLVSGGSTTDNTVTVKWSTTGVKTVSVSYIDNGCLTSEEVKYVSVLNQTVPTIMNPVTSVCLNTSHDYSTQDNKQNYLWTVTGGSIISGQNTSYVTVLWNTAGTGTIKVSYSEAVTATPGESVTTDIIVNTVPSIDPITAPGGVCDNTELFLSDPTVTSTITKNGKWMLHDSSFTSGSTINYSQNGQTLYYEATNACGTAKSNEVAITVLQRPVAGIFQDITLCSGDSQAEIIPSVSSNVNYYQWTNGSSIGIPDYSGASNTTIPGFTAVNTTSVISTTVNVTPYYVSNGVTCDGTPTSFNVTINPLPIPGISGQSTAVKGESGVIYTTESGRNNYVWNITNGTINSGQGSDRVSVTWGNTSPGNISVTYKSVEGCSANNPASESVTLNTQSIPGITAGTGSFTVCPVNNNSYTYTTESGKLDYVWTIVGGTVKSGGDGNNTVTVEWTNGTPGSIKVSYYHNINTPLVESATQNVTKQTVTSISTQPTGGEVCFGGNIPMSVSVDCEGGTATYRWEKDGTTNVGTNSASYTATETGNYTVTVTGTCGTVTSNQATVRVKDQPAATLNGTTTVVTTQQVTYTAGTGSGYNWNTGDASVIAGGTSTDNYVTVSWTATGQKSIAVNYVVDGCPTTVATQVVVVTQQGAPKTDFASDLIANGVCHSITGTYATESGHFKYKWTVTGGTINGVDNAATVTVDWGTAGTGTIKVACSENLAADAVESNLITFTIHDNPIVATLSAPAGICDNKPLNLSAPTVNSTKTVSAQGWKLNGADFISGDSVTYALNGTNLFYQATNICGTAQSNTVRITVYELPSVTVTPQNICQGYSIDLTTAIANPGNYTLAFYTQPNGGMALSSSTVSPTTTKTYYVEATNSNNCTSAVRKPIIVTIESETVITQQPTPVPVVGIGNTFSLSVTATGNNLAYQWYKDGSPITGNVTAATSTLTVTSTTAADYGVYYAVVTGNCGNPVRSNSVTVDILSLDATLRDLQVNGVSLPDFDPQITEYTYTVLCDVSQADIIGITNHTNATVVNRMNQRLETGDNEYAITVTAENGFTTKTYTVKIVRDCYIPKITKDLEDAIICLDESHTFEVQAEGENLTYEWYYGNNRIWGANTNTYTVSKAELKDYERYYVIIRSNFNGYRASVFSKNVRLWVADYLPERLLFSEFPDPAIVGKTYHLKLAGYSDVTKYTWNYHKAGNESPKLRMSNNNGVTFSPETGGPGENEAWATFGATSIGNGSASGSPSQGSGSAIVFPYSGTITVSLEHPCGTRELSRTVTVKYPTGINNVTENTIVVSPNPTAGIIKVSNTEPNQLIKIMDVTGSLKGTYPSQEGATTIDLTNYAKGTYILQYNGKTFKFIKNNTN